MKNKLLILTLMLVIVLGNTAVVCATEGSILMMDDYSEMSLEEQQYRESLNLVDKPQLYWSLVEFFSSFLVINSNGTADCGFSLMGNGDQILSFKSFTYLQKYNVNYWENIHNWEDNSRGYTADVLHTYNLNSRGRYRLRHSVYVTSTTGETEQLSQYSYEKIY